MKVEIIKKETIKPSVPTPNHLKIYNISILDQIAPSQYVSIVLLYSNNDGRTFDQFSQTLKNSLSHTLAIFPPLAGKIKDNVSVNCNDDGVQCYETRVDYKLDNLLSHPNIEYLQRLVLVHDDENIHHGDQLFVQINLFNCGGVALGVTFSHKLCDAATFTTFLKHWSAKTINSGQAVILPDFTVSANFPPRKEISITRPGRSPLSQNLAMSRLVFDGPRIVALKAKSASQNTPQPTRVEAVTGLIGKCAMAAASKSSNDSSVTCLLSQAVNMRNKLIPPLPETAFGNVTTSLHVLHSGQGETDLDIVVDKFRKPRMECYDMIGKLNGEEEISAYVERFEKGVVALLQGGGGIFQNYIFTSWCRFGLYEADFGLGKPSWVGLPVPLCYKNLIIIMDAKDGMALEAYVTLTKQDMDLFLSDPLLLHYASVNPSV